MRTANAQNSLAALLLVLCQSLYIFKAVDRIECLLLDLLAEVSQTGQSLAFANKQFTIQFLFQAFYLLRDSGLHQEQFFGATRNAEIVVNQGDQCLQLA